MKKLATMVLAIVFLSLSVGAMYITEYAALTTGNLNALKFEQQPNQTKMVGGPQYFKVTKATLEYLQQLQKDNKTIEVQNDGGIKIK